MSSPSRPWFLIVVTTMLVAAIVWYFSRDQREVREAVPAPAQSPVTGPTGSPPAVAATATPSPASSSASIRASTPSAVPGESKTFDTFQRRPFAVERSSGKHEWTKEDGKDPDAILDLAHNEVEVQRLMEENSRIQRRQLVYRKEPVFELVQRARAAGEPVRKLTVPGLDGRELEMEVMNADLDPSGLRGTFAGRLPGRGQSMVTLAFNEGREAFSVMSPEDGTFLQGHPREPGEIIVTSFDPDKYQPLPGGEPIKTNEQLPIRK